MSNVDPLARIAELPAVTEAVQYARKAVDRLFGHRVLRRRGSDVSMEVTLRGARASASLAGADIGLETLRQGADTHNVAEADSATDARVRGALRAYGELGPLAQVWGTSPHQALARLHTLIAADAVAREHLGRPRHSSTDAEHGPDPLLDAELNTEEQLGPLPPPEELTVRLDALGQLLSTRSAAPALVTSSVVHGELMTLRPFGWGDGLVARAAERLTLIDRGLDPKALAPAEIGHEHDPDRYLAALADYRSATSAGITRWIEHCAESVAHGARETLATCEAMQRG